MNQLKRIEHLREALAEPLERLEAWRAVQADATRDKLDLAQRFRDGDAGAKRSLVMRTASDVVVTNRKARLVLKLPFVEPRTGASENESPATSVSLQSGLS